MNVRVGYLWAAVAIVMALETSILAQQSVVEGVDQAVRGQLSKVVNVGRHGFRIQPVKITHTSDGLRAEGRIDHKIKGTDDFVYYVIEVKKGQAPVVTLDRIEYNGLFGGKKLILAVSWASNVSGGSPRIEAADKAVVLALKGLGEAQRRLIGKWEPSIPELLEPLASRVARETR